MVQKIAHLAGISLFLILMSGCETQGTQTPELQTGPDAEVTFDGLVRVADSSLDKVWIKPTIDLSQYDAVTFVNAGIHYRAVKPYRRYDPTAESFPLSAKQKELVNKSVVEAFREELTTFKNYRVLDEPGPGVLKVTIAIFDVVSRVPPERTGNTDYYISNLGSAVLAVEIRDSLTDEILARVADGDSVEPIYVRESNPVTNTAELKIFTRKWGNTIREGLDTLHELGCFNCSASVAK